MTVTKSKYTNDDFWSLNEYGFFLEHYESDDAHCIHTHEFSELFIICSGSTNHIIGDKNYPLRKGDVFVIKHNVAHGFENVKNLSQINILYNQRLVFGNESDLRTIPGFGPLFIVEPEIRLCGEYPYVLNLSDSELDYIIELVRLTRNLLEQRNLEDRVTLKMMLLSIISFLSSKYNVGTPRSYQIKLLSEASHYMQQKLGCKIKISDVARYCNISARQLERIFLEYYEISPIEYFTKLRLETAYHLICEGGMQIQQAALHVGFFDPSYFSRSFKSYYGFLPSTLL